jgi:ATP-dependent Zn protease
LLHDLADWRAGIIPFSAISSRAVLASAPGLGKSMFVRSLAKAARLPLVATAVSSWFADSAGGYLNEVIKEIDRLFKIAPSLVFVDEADAIPNRDVLEGRNRDYWTVVVDHLLLKLDSAVSGPAAQTVVIFATNHPRLDPGLLRPGRLDVTFHIGPPDTEARQGILAGHSKLPAADLGPAARASAGMTGADLAQAVKTARRVARVAGRPLAAADVLDAVSPPDDLTDDERWRVAVHESAHAVLRLTAGHRVDFVTLRRNGGGMTAGEERLVLPLRDDVDRTVVAMLAGRAAEQAFLGAPSLGAGGAAASDLALATNLLASAHASYGVGSGGLVWRASPDDAVRVVAGDAELRARIKADLDRLYGVALETVRERRAEIAAVARRLMAAGHLGGHEVEALVRRAGRRKDRRDDSKAG